MRSTEMIGLGHQRRWTALMVTSAFLFRAELSEPSAHDR
jgi:hypothetical protein